MFIVNADGTYKINPAIPDNYKKVLTMNTANTDGLTDEQRIDLLHSVGLTDDDIYNAGLILYVPSALTINISFFPISCAALLFLCIQLLKNARY